MKQTADHGIADRRIFPGNKNKDLQHFGKQHQVTARIFPAYFVQHLIQQVFQGQHSPGGNMKMAAEFMTFPVGGFKQEKRIESRQGMQTLKMTFQIRFIKHDIEHFQSDDDSFVKCIC